jgi:hypothetical protein
MRPTTRLARHRVSGLLLASGLLVSGLTGCGGDDSSDATPTPSPTASATATASTSPSASATPTPTAPTKPAFAPGDKGQKAFAEYVVQSWGYALATNKAAALTGLSPSKKQQCRGCEEISAELGKRAKQGWHVAFPGADVKRTTLGREGDRILATTVADIPASTSYFDDGRFRNDNEAHNGAKFLIDLGVEGQGKKRRYVLLAFSLR